MVTDYWVINGHHENCAYLRSLDYFDNEEERCDCGEDWDDWDDEEYDDDGA